MECEDLQENLVLMDDREKSAVKESRLRESRATMVFWIGVNLLHKKIIIICFCFFNA